MKTRTITTFTAIAAACFAGSSAYAGTHVAPPSKVVVPPITESCVTGDIGFDVVSEYITKGIVANNQGLIVQPYADLHFRLYKSSDMISSITADIGIWNSFHDHHPGTTGAVSNWFEFDFTAGLTFTVNKFSISPQFRVYESPSNSFVDGTGAPMGNVYTVGLNLTYDDKDLWGGFSLHPHAFVELELINSNGNGTRDNGRFRAPSGANGQYYEIGIAPAYTWSELTFTVPITAGFGSGDFYAGNKGFGFASIGADVAYTMAFVPKCLGAWTVHAGAAYYRIGEGAAFAAPGSGTTIVRGFPVSYAGEQNQWVFQGGMKVAF